MPHSPAILQHAVRRRGAAPRRAFTLLETLLVAGAIVAIAAVAFPLYTPMLERQEFDSAVEEAMAQCAHARATAQGRGTAVEVVLIDGGARLEARMVDLLADADDTPGDVFNADGMEGAFAGSAGGRARAAAHAAGIRRARAEAGPAAADDDAPIAAFDLPASTRASLEPPAAADERPEFNEASEGRVALFLPDGSAAVARGFWVSAGTRVARVDVDALLGHATRRDASRAPQERATIGGE